MERGNSGSTPGEDRISKLPDSLIHHILSFLSDTTYAVQTCVLSKRWRYIWTSLPVLKFSDEFHYRESDVEESDYVDHEDMCFINRFIRFVDKVLSLRANNSDIQIFHFEYSLYYLTDDKSDRFINRCIAAAVSHNVQELCIKIKPPNDSEILHLISTCQSLTKMELELSGYDYEDCDDESSSKIFIPREISFPRLKSLCMSLEFFSFYDEESTNNFFSSFPNLESLVIVFRGSGSGFRDMNLRISLPKLKYFNFKLEGQDFEINSEITLYAPSLSSFICNSEMVTNFIVENLPSLATADIQICVAASGREKEFYAQRTMGLLRGIRSVKALTLNFSILKHHEKPPLHEYREEVKSYPENIGGDYWDAELSLPCMICHLKFVEINGLCGCADELKFLEILLKHATVLEKLVIASDATERDSQLEKQMAKFSEKLLKFPTASKKILIFLKSSVSYFGISISVFFFSGTLSNLNI
ncbi:hypothetical protein MKW92_025268 [Papaver armeniacum]|nr:hypothetical protein MKW92_025268 [Papaver armeniacum]